MSDSPEATKPSCVLFSDSFYYYNINRIYTVYLFMFFLFIYLCIMHLFIDIYAFILCINYSVPLEHLVNAFIRSLSMNEFKHIHSGADRPARVRHLPACFEIH